MATEVRACFGRARRGAKVVATVLVAVGLPADAPPVALADRRARILGRATSATEASSRAPTEAAAPDSRTSRCPRSRRRRRRPPPRGSSLRMQRQRPRTRRDGGSATWTPLAWPPTRALHHKKRRALHAGRRAAPILPGGGSPAERARGTGGPQHESVPGRTRTCDPEFRKFVLYPAELRGLDARSPMTSTNPARSRAGRCAAASCYVSAAWSGSSRARHAPLCEPWPSRRSCRSSG